MNIFKRRPMALVCFASICLSIISIFTSNKISVAILLILTVSALASLVLTVLAFIKKKSKKVKEKCCMALTFCLVAIVVLGSCYFSFSKDVYYTKPLSDKTVDICGRIDEINYRYPYAESYNITVFSVNGNEYEFKALLETESSTNLRNGSIFVLKGESESLFSTENMFSLSDGMCLKINVLSDNIESIEIIGKEDDPILKKMFNDMNQDAQHALITNTDKSTAALAGAMLLGNRENLNNELIRDFRRCGISHMLALSGLHMSIIMGLFNYLLKILYVRKKLRNILLALLALIYLAITGFSPSACRSVIMLCFVYLAYMLNCDADSITSLFIGLVIIITISPYAITDVGLWMSFFATLGIIIVSDLTSKLKFHIKKKSLIKRIAITVAASLAITISSTIAVSIFVWLFFGEISLISPLMNIIFAPLMTIVILFSLLSIALGNTPLLSDLISCILQNTCKAIEDISSFFSHFRAITISLKYDFVPYIIIPTMVLLLAMLIIKLKKKWLISVPPAVAILALIISINVYNIQNADAGALHYLKSQRSEMIIVQNSDGLSICDISTGGYSHLYNACQIAFSECYVEIENIILTHYHSYHANSLARICDKYMVRNIYLPAPVNETELAELAEISDRLEERKVNTILYQREEGIAVGTDYYVYVSDTDYLKRSVHPVFSLSIKSPQKIFTYCTSAIEATESQKDVLRSSDIILFGSHGPTVKEFESTKFFEDFIDTTSIIIFSDSQKMLHSNDMIQYFDDLANKNHKIIIEDISHYKIDIS